MDLLKNLSNLSVRNLNDILVTIKISILTFFVFLVFNFSNSVLANAIPPVQMTHSYAMAVKKAAQAVVNIYTDTDSQPAQISQYPRVHRTTLGSGVILDKKGIILTNYHVIHNASQILVALDDGRSAKAKLMGFDRESDLAILQIQLSDLQAALLGNSDIIQVGDVVLAIGNPFGLGQTVTQGIVSAIGRNTVGINQLENYIQTDAAINPGNSGGALINAQGEVIGINTGIYSHSGGYQGVGFAIPVNVVLNIMQQILKTGVVQRGALGLKVRTLHRLSPIGVVVTGFLPDSSARKSGVKEGDVIIALNNQRVHSIHGFFNYIAQSRPYSSMVVTLMRDHKQYHVVVPVGVKNHESVLDDRR